MQLHFVIVLLCLLTVTFAQSYELQLVQVITRHGDRTPDHPITIDPAVWDCTENVVALNSQEGTSNSIAPPMQLYRTLFIENRQTLLGNCSAGQLSSIGAQQTTSLGSSLRSVLIEQNSFLPQEYDPSSIYVRASDKDRCIQSARNILEGLYPPTNNTTPTVIPIWLIEENKDDMQINIKNCPAVLEVFAKTLIENPGEFIKLVEPLVPHRKQLEQIYNTSLPIVAALKNYDNCNCRVHHDIPLPNGMTNIIFNAIQKSYWYGGEILFNSSASITIDNFMHEVVDFMNQKIEGQLIEKFQLFSGHDTTVAPILSLLDVYDGVWPPYASHIEFLLLKDTSTQGYFVEMRYNGDVLTIPECGTSPCDFNTFNGIIVAKTPANNACDLLHHDNKMIFEDIAKILLQANLL